MPTLIALLAAYGLLTALVVAGSPLDRLDLFLYEQRFVPKSSSWHTPVSWWVWIGQGVPASTVAALYAIRRSAVLRSWRPWVMFTLALVGLNVSVGAMKHATGRVGPLFTDQVHTVWAGGTIFPSGHAANAVVMYGLIAMLVPVAHRRLMVTIAAVISVTVGLGTVLLNTHWISDVFGGWMAGLLVLQVMWVAAPWADRLVTRAADRVLPVVGRWWAAVEFHQTPMPKSTVSAPVEAASARPSAEPAPGPVPAPEPEPAPEPVPATVRRAPGPVVAVESATASAVPAATASAVESVTAATAGERSRTPATGDPRPAAAGAPGRQQKTITISRPSLAKRRRSTDTVGAPH